MTIWVYEFGHVSEKDHLLHEEKRVVLVPQDVIEDVVDPELYALEWLEFVVNEKWCGEFVGEVREYTELDWLRENDVPMLF
ncbi:MAG: hypothetical protein KDD89_01470 [Anaerolineales bacterium]|nr:hypothetical protein [Anaerolineales bacterium]